MRIVKFVLVALAFLPALVSFSGASLAMDELVFEVTDATGQVTTLTLDQIEAMGLDKVETTTTWTDGKQVFEGVLLSRLADRFGGQSNKLVVRAINEYEAEIEVSEIRKYRVLLAVRQNGERMSVREKGPGWIVYPRDDHAELAVESHNFKWVWQVGSISFK